MVNSFNVYELDICSRDLNTKISLADCLFEAVKLTQKAQHDEYRHRNCGNGCDARSQCLWANDEWSKNDVIFGVDNNVPLYCQGYPGFWWRTNECIQYYNNSSG